MAKTIGTVDSLTAERDELKECLADFNRMGGEVAAAVREWEDAPGDRDDASKTAMKRIMRAIRYDPDLA